MPRFVVLRHEPPAEGGRKLHWDLMLESGKRLRTWALAREPVVDTPLEAEQLADHRTVYLQYEGPVSGGRGSVSRWDQGWFEWISQAGEELVVRLDGERLSGIGRLKQSPERSQRWTIWFAGG